MRSQSRTYSWYDSVHNYAGYAGTSDGGICFTTGRCDTEKFVADVNTSGLCGHSDWRMPTIHELYNLADRGIASPGPTIDATYFPNTPASSFWSGSPYPQGSNGAWGVYFFYGLDVWLSRSYAGRVRLVCAGQYSYNFDASVQQAPAYTTAVPTLSAWSPVLLALAVAGIRIATAMLSMAMRGRGRTCAEHFRGSRPPRRSPLAVLNRGKTGGPTQPV